MSANEDGDDAGFASAEELECEQATEHEQLRRSAAGVTLHFDADQARPTPAAVVLPEVPSVAHGGGLPAVPTAMASPRNRPNGATAVDVAANVAAREVGNFLTGLTALLDGSARHPQGVDTASPGRTTLERDIAQVVAHVQAGLPHARAQVEAAVPQALQAAQHLAPIAADAATKLYPVLAAAHTTRSNGGSKFASAVAALVAAQQLVQELSSESSSDLDPSQQLREQIADRVAPAARDATDTDTAGGADAGTPARVPSAAVGLGVAPVQAMLASPAEKQQLLMALQSPPVLQMALATPQIRTFIVPLLSDDAAVATLLADAEIALLLSEGAPGRELLLSDPDIGPVLRRASAAFPAVGGGAAGRRDTTAHTEDGDDILDAALAASEIYTPAPPRGGGKASG